MHELSLVDALFDEIERALVPHPAAGVRVVRVRVGELAGVEPELFRAAFEVLRAERGQGDAALELSHEDAAWSCSTCGVELARGSVLRCDACGGAATLSRGGGVFLDRLELEVVDV